MFPRSCSARTTTTCPAPERNGRRPCAGAPAAFGGRLTRLSQDIPPGIEDQAGYDDVPQNRADVDAAVRRTTRPTVVTLLASAIAASATIAVFSARSPACSPATSRSGRASGRWVHRGAPGRGSGPRPRSSPPARGCSARSWSHSRCLDGPIGSVRSVVPHPGVSARRRAGARHRVLGGALLLVVVGLSWSVAGAAAAARGAGRPEDSSVRSRRCGGPAARPRPRASAPCSRCTGSGGIAVVGCAVALVVVVGAAL